MSRVRDVLLVKRHTSYHRDDIVWILIRLFLLNFLARRDNRHYTLARGDSSLAFYGEALKFHRLQMFAYCKCFGHNRRPYVTVACIGSVDMNLYSLHLHNLFGKPL